MNHSSRQTGMTLIEILIVIAILGILFAGGFSVWGFQVKTQRMMAQRIQIATILDTQMAALMHQDELPEPSQTRRVLPVPLEDMLAPKTLFGYYFVRPTDQRGVVQLDVVLQQIDSGSSNHYRLTALRSIEVQP